MKKKQKINFGIIGVGRIGKIHIENLAHRIPDAQVVAVSDVVESELRKVAEQYNVVNAFTDYRDVLNFPDINAIAICSSTDTHAQIIQEAALSGKDIFCEKPIDLSFKKVIETLKVVKKSKVKFFLGFNRRFDPNFLKVHEIVHSGRIGKPHVLTITSRDPAPPPLAYLKASGGIFLDMTIHDFDMARYLIDSEVVEVFAKGKVLVDSVFKKANDLDTIVVTLTYANGAMASINNSRQAVYGYDQRVEVLGSEGMVTVKNNTPDNHIHFNKKGTHSSLPLNFFMERYTQSYLGEMRNFIECIQKNKKPSVSGEDGLKAMIIAIAAKKSVEENRPVKTNEIY
ncbi:MAG: inositol 2-dehydrogenase [Ignavibacteria bacterium RBG_13_36_8]|nr:MAG: inositol 2-dehydrogenase [Ignavibacteria bacterium RBG_13_36_8]